MNKRKTAMSHESNANGVAALRGVHVSHSSTKNSFWVIGGWIWRGIIAFVSSCFSFISFGCVFLGIAAIVHGSLFLDTILGLVKGGAGWVEGVVLGVASVVMWNKPQYLSTVATAAL